MPTPDAPGADPWDDFLAPPTAPLTAPPPAPMMGRQIEPSAPAPRSVLDLGAPPDDAMGAAKWAYQIQMRMADDVIRDKAMSPSRRRAELQKIFAGAAKWMTDALRYDVAQTIEEDRRQLDAKRRGRATAKATKRTAPAPPLAKVIPITRDA